MIFSSRGVRVRSMFAVCSFRSTLMTASAGEIAARSSINSPRLVSPSSPIGISSDIGTCLILSTLRLGHWDVQALSNLVRRRLPPQFQHQLTRNADQLV